MSRVSYRRPRDDDRSPRRMMARPLHEPVWALASREPTPVLRRLLGPLVLLLIGGAAIVGVVAMAGSAPDTGAPPPASSPSATALAHGPSPTATSPPASPTARPSGLTGGQSGASTPRPSATPPPTSRPTAPPPVATPSPTPRPDAFAPQSAEEFDQVGGEVIDITFPLKPNARYRYRDNWWDPRAGEPLDFNHARSRRGGGVTRAHDGIDIYVRRGSPVVAPFAGTVIDPAERWSPWHERYGGTVVIVSSEPQSEGYAAVLAHLDAVFVEPGTQVRRGEVVGLAGDTGNADGFRVHLHFELRAPFELPWLELGGERLIDAFNPFPSLVAADPRRD